MNLIAFPHSRRPKTQMAKDGGKYGKKLITLCISYGGTRKALKAFLKPFEAPQRSVIIKILLDFYFNTTFKNGPVQ